MKTIREWLETLPDGIRERAIKNAEDSKWDVLGQCDDSLSQALRGAFIWSDTKENHAFWSEVDDKAMGLRDNWPSLDGFPPIDSPDPMLERLDRIEAELRRLTELLTAEREKSDRREKWPEDLPRLEGFWFFGEGPIKRPEGHHRMSDDIAVWLLLDSVWQVGGYGDGANLYAIRKGSELARINGLEGGAQ